MHHFGQLNEQLRHAALKAHYAQPPAQTEALVDGYLVYVCFLAGISTLRKWVFIGSSFVILVVGCGLLVWRLLQK